MLRVLLAAFFIAQATCYSVDLSRSADSAYAASVVDSRTNNGYAANANADSVVIQARNAAPKYAFTETRSKVNARNDDGSDNGYVDEIPGAARVDYSIYTQDKLPETSFRCENQQFKYGYYADVEAKCQLFHVCEANVKYSFLCPNGTIFSQQNLVCDWWFNVNCNDSPASFGVNANIGIIPPSTEVPLVRAAASKNANVYEAVAAPAVRSSNSYAQPAPIVRSNNGYAGPAPVVRSNNGYASPAASADIVVEAARAALSPSYESAVPVLRNQRTSY